MDLLGTTPTELKNTVFIDYLIINFISTRLERGREEHARAYAAVNVIMLPIFDSYLSLIECIINLSSKLTALAFLR